MRSSSFDCHISTDICHQANASVFDKVVVDLFLDCLFMIMKLLACVIHPDRPRIWDGRLLLQWAQWTTLMLPLLFYFQLLEKKLSEKIRIKWNKKKRLILSINCIVLFSMRPSPLFAIYMYNTVSISHLIFREGPFWNVLVLQGLAYLIFVIF